MSKGLLQQKLVFKPQVNLDVVGANTVDGV